MSFATSPLLDATGVPIDSPPSPPRTDWVIADVVDKQFDWINLIIEVILSDTALAPLISPPGKTIDTLATKTLSAIPGIRIIRAVPGIEDLINAWIAENIALIRGAILGTIEDPDVDKSLIGDMKSTIIDAFRRGDRVEVLRETILQRYSVSRSRADLIARDQTLKLNGQITKHRQEHAGIRQYKWITSRDDRVRPRHRDLHNKIQSWASPPRVAPGRYEHPGGDFQCRCTALPVIPSWME
jgi:SPP1 gp7 family putative phage head morphogenesis protein